MKLYTWSNFKLNLFGISALGHGHLHGHVHVLLTRINQKKMLKTMYVYILIS